MKALRYLLIILALILIFIAPLLWIIGPLFNQTLITSQEYKWLFLMFVIGLLLYFGNGGNEGAGDR